jgi:bifunctional non-homologous end joining protein LigD
MLCTLLRQPVRDPDYIHEIKFDGYRIIAHVNKRWVRLDSRSGLDYTSKYGPVVKALQKLNCKAVFDGEVCALNMEGNPDFDSLQKPSAGTKLVYYVFDLIWMDGYDISMLPLLERKSLLAQVVDKNDIIRYSEHFKDGVKLFAKVRQLGMEGIVSKLSASEYLMGSRGRAWYKTPTEIRQEFVIGGWVESENREFKTILFGAYKRKKLEWIGHAGGGFKHREMSGILKKLKGLEIPGSPFVNKVEYTGKVHWVKPELVANFKFATFTKSGRIRKPAIFLGFRTDKSSGEVVREIPAAPEKKTKKLPALSAGSNWKKIKSQQISHRDTVTIGECSIEVYDIDRVIWKGVTKMQLLQYYHSVHRYLQPHIAGRPQSLHIKPVNANAPGFYIKDMESRQPDCGEIFTVPRKHKKPGKRNHIDYLVCNNEATLLYMINLGCIDINPWMSTIHTPEEPDFIVIDLDPSDEDFKKAIEAGIAAKQVLDTYKIRAFLKTSGKTGLHIYLPCRGFSFPQARTIAESICKMINQSVPEITTTQISVTHRGNKLYLDPNQNDYADTVAAPYSARPYKIPAVSTPLEWKELNRKLDPAAFTIHTIAKRLEKKGDLFSEVLSEKIALKNRKPLSGLL